MSTKTKVAREPKSKAQKEQNSEATIMTKKI